MMGIVSASEFMQSSLRYFSKKYLEGTDVRRPDSLNPFTQNIFHIYVFQGVKASV